MGNESNTGQCILIEDCLMIDGMLVQLDVVHGMCSKAISNKKNQELSFRMSV